MKTLLFVLYFMSMASALSADEPQHVPISQLGEKFTLVGKLHEPLGRVITIAGVMVEGPFKGYEGGPNLRVQRIQGRYYQEDIQIVLKPYFYEWGDKATVGGDALPKLKVGETYEMEGFETGGYVGIPGEVFKRGGVVIQTTSHYFRHHFVVTKARRIEPIEYSPRMLSGQRAILNGTAETRNGHSAMIGPDWSVIVRRERPWPKDTEGKSIETYGLYNPDATWRDDPKMASKTFDLVDGVWRLVRLEDQVGKTVSLRGRASSLNGVWWFHYRGIDLYVDEMEQLPGWNPGNHWRPIEIEGRLERAKLPRLDQVLLKPDRDLADYFIVRNATWKPVPSLLFPERPLPEQEAEQSDEPKSR